MPKYEREFAALATEFAHCSMVLQSYPAKYRLSCHGCSFGTVRTTLQDAIEWVEEHNAEHH